jgi:hypothetical protein
MMGPVAVGATVPDTLPLESQAKAIDDDLVRSIQERLHVMGLFEGALDGKPSQALDDAIRSAQRSMGVPEDGRITTELLAGLEDLAGQATALRLRLDEARTRQTGEARDLLLGSAATRDLVSGVVARTAWPKAPCGRLAEAACLVAPALEALDAVGDADRRDWVLASLARALARDGDADVAQALIARMADPRMIVASLGDIAVAHAEAGNTQAAIAAADTLPARNLRWNARVDAAMALLERGDPIAASGMVRPLATALSELAEGGDVALMADLARILARVGDAGGALALLDHAEAEALGQGSTQGDDLLLGALAQTLAEIGDIDRARNVVDTITDSWRRAPLFARLAAAAAEQGAFDVAAALVAEIREARYRAPAEATLAGALARADEPTKGLAMLDSAEASAHQVPRGFARNFALASVAIAAGDLGFDRRAAALAGEVTDPRLRSRALLGLAGQARSRGDIVAAAGMARDAAAQIPDIADPVERAAARAELLLDGETDEAWVDIVADVMRLDEPWQRARSRASLAAIAVRISEPAP